MALIQADTSLTIGAPYSANSVCKYRIELLDRLARTLGNLYHATLQFQNRAERDDSNHAWSIPNEILQLRIECGDIRTELESHRSSHGC